MGQPKMRGPTIWNRVSTVICKDENLYITRNQNFPIHAKWQSPITTHLARINNDGVITSKVILPIFLCCFFIWTVL